MKTTILTRGLRPPSYHVFMRIAINLLRAGHSVHVQHTSNYKPEFTDMLLMWGYKRPQVRFYEDFKKCNNKMEVYYVELGWFDRGNNFLFYNKDFKRPRLFRKHNFLQYKNAIKIVPSEEKVWVVFLQYARDANLRKTWEDNSYNKWIFNISNIFEKTTDRKVVFRKHPQDKKDSLDLSGLLVSDKTLEEDLGRAIGVVAWNSSAILKAMMFNIPSCVYDFPELSNNVQVGLTSQWIKDVENNKAQTGYNEILKLITGQQISLDDIKRLRFYGATDWYDKSS